MKRSLLLLLPLLLSCNRGTTTLDFGSFTMEAPAQWKIIKEKGVDSYIGRIAIDEKDTLSFDLGQYSSSLDEIYLAWPDTLKSKMALKNKNNMETIDGRKAKIVRPKRHGHGTTGIYIDSLWSPGTCKFQLNGNDLKAENEGLVLTAIRTIKFIKPEK